MELEEAKKLAAKRFTNGILVIAVIEAALLVAGVLLFTIFDLIEKLGFVIWTLLCGLIMAGSMLYLVKRYTREKERFSQLDKTLVSENKDALIKQYNIIDKG